MMPPEDSISPISPYAPGKAIVPRREVPREKQRRREDDSKKPTKNKLPASQSEIKKPDETGSGVDRYA